MRKQNQLFYLVIFIFLALTMFAAGCDDSDSTKNTEPEYATVSGHVVDGPIKGVYVEVVDVEGAIFTSSAPTDERGWYSVKVLKSAKGPFRVRTKGNAGNFNALYHSVLKKIDGDLTNVQLTPMTTVIYYAALTQAGGDAAAITAAHIDTAKANVQKSLGLDLDFDPLTTQPVVTEDIGNNEDALTEVLSYRTAISVMVASLNADDDFGVSKDFSDAASTLALDLIDGDLDGDIKVQFAKIFKSDYADKSAEAVKTEASGFNIKVNVTIFEKAVKTVTDKTDDNDTVQPITLAFQKLGTHATGIFDEGAAEIATYDPETKRLFVVNGEAGAIDVLDASDPAAPTLAFSIDLAPYGKGANSVAFHNGVLAAAVENEDKQAAGKVVFFNANGDFLNSVPAGALPDMVTFTPDGKRVLTANEGEPNDDYTNDPEGSVTIVDLSAGVENASANTVGFTSFNDQIDALKAAGVRIFGPNATVAQDVEPEYVAITPDSKTAWICLQENNALAELDIESATIKRILPFGFKDHSLAGNGMDASNKDDQIDIRPRPVMGMYMPDAIAVFEAGGTTYIATANEGDSRDYDGFGEETRVADLTLDPAAFPNAAALQDDAELGRLKTTTTLGDTDGDGDVDTIYAYGARSFSIWTPAATGLTLVYDSGDDFERITARKIPSLFNASNDDNEADDRSDDKGPEPEGIEIGEIEGRRIAFIGLERVGGVMVYDITDPTKPEFIDYVNHRDSNGDPEAGSAGDLGPEGIKFISAADSPTDHPLLAVANEVSGTTTFYSIQPGFRLTVVHVNDTHSHLDPTDDSLYFDGVQTYLEIGGYARLATEAASVRDANPDTLVLHAGDAVQGTLYFTKYDGAADLDLMNRIGFDAMAVGNHEFDRGPEFLAGFIEGADFPLLGANIDASADANLNGKIAPYAIKTLNGEKVGIIGLITPETQNISSPGDNVVFLDQEAAARNAIKELEDQGVNKIIVLSHLGFDLDKELAQTVEGVDIIVGGHSHTLLGDLEDIGKSPIGDYPMTVQGPKGDNIYIVHSWEWAKAVGHFEVKFNNDGKVIAYDGAATLLVGDEFRQKDADGNKVVVDDETKKAILAAIDAHPGVKVVAEKADLLAALAPYAEGIADMQTEVVASVTHDLLHIREPGQHTSGADLSGGSMIAPIVCEGMLWKANDVGLNADLCLQNAGGVRIDIPQGDLTVGTAYELLPFGNTMVALDLTGAEIKAALENGVERSSGAWPYVAGVRYTVDVSRPEGQKIVSVEIMADGAWTPLNDAATYRIVTNSYIASGGDGYDMLADADGYRYDTGFVDAEVFMAYAEHLETLIPPETTYVVYMDGGGQVPVEPVDAAFAVFSDPHYFDPALLINDGPAFQEYLSMGRKLLKESEAILESAIDSIQKAPGLDFVLVPGDLTKDGEKTSHEKFAGYLATLEAAGVPVYVVPGNHDVNNPHAYAYDGESKTAVDSVSPDQFAQIYNDYGYGEALSRDPASLSYMAEPVPGLCLLALDPCRYDENEAAGKAVTGGRFAEETLNWIIDRLAEAKAAEKRVVAMMHHGLLEHFTGQSQANPGSEYVIENWETVSKTLAQAGLPVVFTGHFHAQDVATKSWEVNGQTLTLTDVQTGSLVTYPNPYRIVDIKDDGNLDIKTRYVTEVDYNTGFMTFPEYAENYLLEGLNNLVYASLTMAADQGGYGLPAEQANQLTPMIVAAFAAHYAGNETPDAETLAAITNMMNSADSATKSLGQSLYALWMDPTLDVNVAIDLAIGEASSPTVEKSWRVSASSDDMEEYVADGTMDDGSSDLELGYEKPGDDNQMQQIVGIRFQAVDIPRGARITAAHIQFACDEADKYQDPFSMTIRGEDRDNPETFTTETYNVSSRPETFASATWADIPVWENDHDAGPDQLTPDLSAIVQEIVNRPGWLPGNAMAFIFCGTGTRTVESFDGEEDLAPLLTVRFIGREETPTTARFRLVWTDDPTTTTTVAWDQLRGENPTLHYGPQDLGTDADAYPHYQAPDRTSDYHDMNNQFVRLNSLTPDTEYYFVVKDSEGVSERYWFRTAPDAPEPFTFISGADTKSIGEPLEAGRWTSTIVPKLRPLFVIFNGDFCTGDGTNAAYWQQWLDDWHKLTRTEDGRLFPIIPVMGNHELGDHEVLYGIFDAGNHDPAQPEDYTYYGLSIGGDLMRIYNLNSEVDSVSQEAFNLQTEWLATDLSAHQNSTFKIGGFHKPIRPHTASKSENDYLYEAWADIFYDYGFDLAFTADSHLHGVTLPVSPDNGPDSFQGFVTDYDRGTMYVGEGAWGASYRDNNDDKPWTLQSGAFQQLKWLQVFPENGTEPAHIDIRTIITAVRDESGTMVSKVDNAAGLSEDDLFSVPAGLELFEDDAVGTVIRYPMEPLEGDAPIDAIVDLAGEATSYTEIDLTWTPPATWADGSVGGVALMQQAGANGLWEMVSGNLPPDADHYTLRFLDDGVDYGFKIRAWNRYGYSAYSNEITVSTPVDDRTRISFQEGVEGYAGTYDVGYFQSNPDFSDPENYEMASDGNINTPDSEEQALIRFENIIGPDALPADATVSQAILRVFSTGDTDSVVSIHRMLVGWTEDATWNSMDDGVEADGVEAAAAADHLADGIRSGEFYEFDVTVSLKAWQADPSSNHGWVFLNSGDDGWDLATSEENDPDLRPILTVYYSDSGD